MSKHLTRHLHSSSRFSRPPESLERDLDAWSQNAAGWIPPDIITLTEVQHPKRARMLREGGWGVVQFQGGHGMAENALVFRKAVWSLVHAESVLVSDVPFYATTGRRRAPIYAVFAVLQHNDSGKRLLCGVSHLPSHVEGNNPEPPGADRRFRLRIWSRTVRRVQAHISAMRNIKRAQRRIMRVYKPHGKMFTADWNLNLRRRAVRVMFRVLYPGMRPTFGPPFPQRGTFGQRLIDFTLIGRTLRPVTKPRILARSGSSDHLPYYQVLDFRR